MITLADDGEKFGVWPGTYEHVYQNGWLDRFFDALVENTDWLEVTTYAEYLSNTFPSGMVYLPTGSYREMGKWALPRYLCQRRALKGYIRGQHLYSSRVSTKDRLISPSFLKKNDK